MGSKKVVVGFAGEKWTAYRKSSTREVVPMYVISCRWESDARTIKSLKVSLDRRKAADFSLRKGLSLVRALRPRRLGWVEDR